MSLKYCWFSCTNDDDGQYEDHLIPKFFSLQLFGTVVTFLDGEFFKTSVTINQASYYPLSAVIGTKVSASFPSHTLLPNMSKLIHLITEPNFAQKIRFFVYMTYKHFFWFVLETFGLKVANKN